jgi:phenylpropionate dioxygenase-like ring-hydroxylating dioxygenase large terminal subunit
MFELLPAQWTPTLPLAGLDGAPLPVEIAGERLVVFRGAGGQWHALLDRCPHRGAALSLGAVTSDGELQCRYHGWRFAGDGRCTRVPLNELKPQALARISAIAVPVLELAGALWIYTRATSEGPPPPPVIPDSLRGPPAAYGTYCQEWRAHWTRAVENFIDFAHPPYLHRDTIGAYSHDYAEGGAVAFVSFEATGSGFSTRNGYSQRGPGFRVDWFRPNLAQLHFGAGPDGQLHVFSIPVNAQTTRVMTVRRLPAGADPAAWSARAASVDHVILDEDRLIVESQHGPVDDAAETSVSTDAPSVAFRRWYRDMLASAGALERQA